MANHYKKKIFNIINHWDVEHKVRIRYDLPSENDYDSKRQTASPVAQKVKPLTIASASSLDGGWNPDCSTFDHSSLVSCLESRTGWPTPWAHASMWENKKLLVSDWHSLFLVVSWKANHQ